MQEQVRRAGRDRHVDLRVDTEVLRDVRAARQAEEQEAARDDARADVRARVDRPRHAVLVATARERRVLAEHADQAGEVAVAKLGRRRERAHALEAELVARHRADVGERDLDGRLRVVELVLLQEAALRVHAPEEVAALLVEVLAAEVDEVGVEERRRALVRHPDVEDELRRQARDLRVADELRVGCEEAVRAPVERRIEKLGNADAAAEREVELLRELERRELDRLADLGRRLQVREERCRALGAQDVDRDVARRRGGRVAPDADLADEAVVVGRDPDVLEGDRAHERVQQVARADADVAVETALHAIERERVTEDFDGAAALGGDDLDPGADREVAAAGSEDGGNGEREPCDGPEELVRAHSIDSPHRLAFENGGAFLHRAVAQREEKKKSRF